MKEPKSFAEMNKEQQEKALQIWKDYLEEQRKLLKASPEELQQSKPSPEPQLVSAYHSLPPSLFSRFTAWLRAIPQIFK